MVWNRLIPAEIFARVSAEGGPFFLFLADSDIRLRYSAERGGYFLPVLAFAMLRLASRVKGLRFLPVFARAMCLHSSVKASGVSLFLPERMLIVLQCVQVKVSSPYSHRKAFLPDRLLQGCASCLLKSLPAFQGSSTSPLFHQGLHW